MKEIIPQLRKAIEKAKKKGVTIGGELDASKAVYSFQERERLYLQRSIWTMISQLEKKTDDPLVKFLAAAKTYDEMEQVLKELENREPRKEKKELELDIKIPQMPKEIEEEIEADIAEMEKCFTSGLYRSSIILCGRILETALHRKMYEVTDKDVLESNPGIGLGKLIAKLKENDVEFLPGTAEQINLVNEMRINSVHKKQKTFYPTKEQAHATILFSMDILKKLF
jgi:hypothetical protein